jgi:hypothetical protein
VLSSARPFATTILVLGLFVHAGLLAQDTASSIPGVLPDALPDRLSNTEFWSLRQELSEPGGYFRITDNYTSNESEIGFIATALRRIGTEGGVYIGVGPEQNLTYISVIRPRMAFVVDIRRQAAMQHLMFKGLFELASDRAEFISLLFAKPRPATIGAQTRIQDIWHAFTPASTDPDMAARTAKRLVHVLTETRGFPLTPEESAEVAAVYQAFVGYGPAISTRGAGGFGGGSTYTFADLTGWATDETGQVQSFLSSEENYRVVKSLHERNLVVPVTGDFGGPKALRALGAYLKRHGGVVTAFYVSNVEQYLFQDGKAGAFYDNVAELPIDVRSVFIRPYSLRRSQPPRPLCPIGAFLGAAQAGQVRSNFDSLACAGR